MYWVERGFQTELSAPFLEKTSITSNGEDTVDDIKPLDLSLPNRSRVRDNSQKDCPDKPLDHSMLQRNMFELTSTGTSDSFTYSSTAPKKAEVLCHEVQDKTTSTRLLALLSQVDVVSSHEDHRNSCKPLMSPFSSPSAQTSCFTVFPSRYLDHSNTFSVTSVPPFLYESSARQIPRLIPTINITPNHPIGMQISYEDNAHPFLPSADVTWTPSSRTFHRPSPYQHLSLPLKYPYSNNLIPSWSEMGRICTAEWLLTGQEKLDKSLPLTTHQQLPIILNTDNRSFSDYQSSSNQGNLPKNISFLYTYPGVVTSSISATNIDHRRSNYSIMDNDEHKLITKYSDNIGQSIYHSALTGFPSGISSGDQKQDLHTSNAFNNPFYLCSEARMTTSVSQITYPNFKLLPGRPKIQNKSMLVEAFTNSSFPGIRGNLSGPQGAKLSSFWNITKDTPTADLTQRNNSETFSREKETEFCFIERKQGRRGGEHSAESIKHSSYNGYPNFACIPPALRENQSSMTIPSDLRSNNEFELNRGPSNQARRRETETSYDELLLTLRSNSGRGRSNDRIQDSNYMKKDVLNSQTSCSSLTALNQQLQNDKPMSGMYNTFGNYVYETNSRFVDTIRSHSENSPFFFVSPLNNKQAPRRTSPCQESKEIFKCDKTDRANECQKLVLEANKDRATITNRKDFKIKNLLSRPDTAKPALENRPPIEKDPLKCTSFVDCDISVACRTFRQTPPPSNHNNLTARASQSERSFGTSAKPCEGNSNVYDSKSKEACHACSAIQRDTCRYHLEDPFRADHMEYSLGHNSETSALPHPSIVQDLNSPFISKNQKNATEENLWKVPHIKAFREPYQEARATEKSNPMGSECDCSCKLESFVKGQEAEIKLQTGQSYFKRDTFHSAANPETRHYVQVTSSTKSHPYQCKVCNSCCLTFSALLQHQSSGCFAALPSFVEAHASDCLGKHGRYDKSIPGDKCECTPCSLCGGIFSSKFKVFSHFKRGCYRPREKVGCEKQSKAASPYNDLANTTRSQEKLFKMKFKGRSKGKRKYNSTFLSFSKPKSQGLKRTDIDESQENTKIWNQSKAIFVQESAEVFKFHGSLPNKSTFMSTITLKDTQGLQQQGNNLSISNGTESKNASLQLFSQERDNSVAEMVRVSQTVLTNEESKDPKVLPRSSNLIESQNSNATFSKDYKEEGSSTDSTPNEGYGFIGKTFKTLQKDKNDFICQMGADENEQLWEKTEKCKMIEQSNSLTKKSSCSENKAEAKNPLVVTVESFKGCAETESKQNVHNKTEVNGSGQNEVKPSQCIDEGKINKTDDDEDKTKPEEKEPPREMPGETKTTQKPAKSKIHSKAEGGFKVEAEFDTCNITETNTSRQVFTITTAFKPCQTSAMSLNKILYSKHSPNQALNDPSNCSPNKPPTGPLQFHSLDDTHVRSSTKLKRTLPYDADSDMNVKKKIRKNDKTYAFGNVKSEMQHARGLCG